MYDKEDGINIKPLPPHYDVILYLGQYEKSSVPVGHSLPLDAVKNQSDREIVGQDYRVTTTDHDLNYYKVITSVTIRINITQTYGKYLYSGGTNVPGYIFLLVHNSTTDRSNRLKHISNTYEVLINLSRKSRSTPSDQFTQPFPYHFHFETDVSVDHRGTFFKPGCISWSFLGW